MRMRLRGTGWGAVPVTQFDRDHQKPPPLVYAYSLADHRGAGILTNVHQDNAVSHTGADARSPLLVQPTFAGEAQSVSDVCMPMDILVAAESRFRAGRPWPLRIRGASARLSQWPRFRSAMPFAFNSQKTAFASSADHQKWPIAPRGRRLTGYPTPA
jgi:hypothetical protein